MTGPTVRTIAALAALMAATAAPLRAQTARPRASAPDSPLAVVLRPFVLVTGEQFLARQTFGAVLGGSFEPFFGGGLQFAMRDGLFVEVGASYFSKTGQRVFVNNGQVFPLGIASTTTVTPVEFTVGYRMRLTQSRFVPYLGGGVGWYLYRETDALAAPGENVDTGHVGFLIVYGTELRLSKWVSGALDGQFTGVPGILGSGGASQAFGEGNLGGIAVRFRIIIGR